MKTITEIIKESSDFACFGKIGRDEVIEAENQLELHFSKDYKEYVESFGAASFDGHEWCGVVPFPRLNVVDVTKREWLKNDNVPQCLYVVEKILMDGIIIWQDESGTVYYSEFGQQPKPIAQSLMEYLEQ